MLKWEPARLDLPILLSQRGSPLPCHQQPLYYTLVIQQLLFQPTDSSLCRSYGRPRVRKISRTTASLDVFPNSVLFEGTADGDGNTLALKFRLCLLQGMSGRLADCRMITGTHISPFLPPRFGILPASTALGGVNMFSLWLRTPRTQ